MTSKAETAYIALGALLKTVASVTLVSRRLTDAANVPQEQLPAIFINETGEEIEPSKGFEGANAKQTLSCDLYLYCFQGAQEAVCSTQINELIQAIRDALKPLPYTTTQTLSDTVSHCWISGKIEIIEGIQNGHGLAIIPVYILTNY